MRKENTIKNIDDVLRTNVLINASFKCEKCKVRPKVRINGELRKWCERCVHIYNRMVTREYSIENTELTIATYVEPLYSNATIMDFDDKIRQQVARLGDNDLFLFGPVGTGKTHLMAALLRLYYFQGYTCSKINFDDFCVQVRSTMSPASKKTEWDMIEPLKNDDLLVIDDLGLRAKMETDFAYVTLYSILNKRQERMLPTFISSNKSIEQLGQTFDARIASRLRTAVVIEMKGKDRRKKAGE